MDRRSWPWKRKSSDKAAAEKAAALLDSAGASLAAAGSQVDQDKYKKPNYVQISVESYSHLTGLEEQVKTYEEQVKNYEEQVQSLEDQNKELNEKLSEAQAEITNKDELVKQHAKVAEDAVSGWEKAEAEAAALKTHLESVTLLKLTAEDRAAHLDGALKECMRQIRNLKEEHEQEIQEVVLTKTKQCEKIKLELETKIAELDQELLKAESDNAAISRSMQERSNMLIKISEEKAQAEAEIELLKSNIDSCEREINSLKYELHVVSKELEIRNEEKNMCVKSAEVANKQHTEGVKKIAKLEAECQRLRGLVRKKLPGPAALAQMKLEVESLGRDYGETRTKRSPVKPSSPHFSPATEFSLDSVHKVHKENDFLTERLLTMEEETKMLKEALAKRNSELQASRNLCAKTASKLQSLEAQLQLNNQHRSPSKFNIQISAEGSVIHNASNPPSLTSMSEDGNDDAVSCAESWSTTLISEHSQIRKENNNENLYKTGSTNNLELMDDFLEMEKLACLPNDSNGAISASDRSNKSTTKAPNCDASAAVSFEKQQDVCKPESPATNHINSDVESQPSNPGTDAAQLPLRDLQCRISSVLQSTSKDADMVKVLEDIKQVVQEAHDTLHQCSVTSVSEEKQSPGAACNRICPDDAKISTEKGTALRQNSEPATESEHLLSQDLADAISRIYEFVNFLGKEAAAAHQTPHDGDYLSQKIEEFSVTFNKVLHNKTSLDNFILDLSYVLACELRFNVMGYKGSESETSSPDCIDKVALPENRVIEKDSSREGYLNGCAHISDPEVPDDGNIGIGYEANTAPCRTTMEDFEQLKSERDVMVNDLARYTESLETTKSQLQETEQLLAEAKSQLASAQKSNSLADTQLKCMAESYRSLEKRAEELETEVNLLRAKTEALENELQQEKNNHQDALARCKDLEEQLERNESALASAEDAIKTKQEKELTAAAEKLSECQETIFLLGKQLKALRPQTDFLGSPYSERSQKGDEFSADELPSSSTCLQDIDQAEMESSASTNIQKVGAETLSNTNTAPGSPNDAEAKEQLRSPVSSKQSKHKHTKSSSSSSSGPTPEKQSRGFSRFFSSKGKNGH